MLIAPRTVDEAERLAKAGAFFLVGDRYVRARHVVRLEGTNAHLKGGEVKGKDPANEGDRYDLLSESIR